jgi:hypothetical protein
MNELFFKDLSTGETFRLSDVKDIELTYNNDDVEKESKSIWNKNREFCCEMTVPKPSIYKLMLNIGIKYLIPNNWLRMHHYPMNRKKGWR